MLSARSAGEIGQVYCNGIISQRQQWLACQRDEAGQIPGIEIACSWAQSACSSVVNKTGYKFSITLAACAWAICLA